MPTQNYDTVPSRNTQVNAPAPKKRKKKKKAKAKKKGLLERY
tara:strand:- start:454 stop:579 length:126 start_codon:yes stop_codon:yes gene_type:complete